MIAGRFLEQELNTFQRDMQLNYFGTLHALKIVLPGMVHRRSGHVLMLTSVCAAIGEARYQGIQSCRGWGSVDEACSSVQGCSARVTI